jgi:hypothetical protein
MEILPIIQLIAILLPEAEKIGLSIEGIVSGLKAGKTVEELVAEAQAKRDDLEELPFTAAG